MYLNSAYADELVSRALIDSSMRIGRPVENGALAAIDSQAKVIVIQTYDGLLKVVFNQNYKLLSSITHISSQGSSICLNFCLDVWTWLCI